MLYCSHINTALAFLTCNGGYLGIHNITHGNQEIYDFICDGYANILAADNIFYRKICMP